MAPGQLSQMGGHQFALGIEEQRGGQASAVKVATGLAAQIQQHMVQIELLGSQKAADGAGPLALVEKDDVDLGVLLLGGLQNRHFPATGWTPAGPQVEHYRLAAKPVEP